MALLQHLEKAIVFLRIMEHGSLRQAAKRLRVSQPALSRTMAILESECDAVLATRGNSGLRPTAVGTELLDLAQQVEQLVASFESARTRASLQRRAPSRLGTYESIAVYLFPQFFAQASSSNAPRITLGIDESSNLMKRLIAGDFDCIVSVNPERRARVHTEWLFDDDFGFFASPAVAKLVRRSLMVASRVAFVPTAAGADGVTVEAHLAPLGLDPHRSIPCQTFETVKAICMAGVGPAILPVRVAAQGVASGQLVELDLPGVPARFGRHSIGWSCLLRRANDVALVDVWNHLRAFAREQGKGSRRA